MSTFAVTVVPVQLDKCPNSDRLSIVKVKGWQVVCRTADFEGVKLAAYLPIDSTVPDISDWEFLRERKFRIRSIRLRGVLSQGLLIPAKPEWVEGQDVTEELGVKKYEPPPPSANFSGDMVTIPSGFQAYTGIENIKNYTDVIQPGELVTITEKLHGCVQADTKISMFDGNRQRILNIKEGDMVLGVDDKNHVVPTRIIKKINNGKSKQWLKITGTRRKAGRGNYYFSIICTPEHKFYRPDLKKYILAKNLAIGDPILNLRSELGLTAIQEQVLLGKMLGDGSFTENDCSAHIVWSHRKQDFQYGKWTAGALGDLDSGWQEERISGYGSKMIRFRTTNSAWIREKFRSFIKNGKKIVPEWVIDELNPIALAFWYMDDGSLSAHEDQEDRVSFATCAFSDKDCNILIKGLNKFNIKAKLSNNSDGYNRIYLDSCNAEKLFLLVAPYIPSFMQRKLPKRYRGGIGWLPKKNQQYKPLLVQQEILSIKKIPIERGKTRYDLETETHNYFANGILVHNSNFRAALLDNVFCVGSHNTARSPEGTNIYSQIAREFKLEERLRQVFNQENVTIYGEIYGKGVQHLAYGQEKPSLRLFDIFLSGRYVDYAQFILLAKQLKLEIVPMLKEGPFEKEWLKEADGQSTLADHIREGCVIKPQVERWDAELGRVILKRISDEYLIKRGDKDDEVAH